MFGHFQLLVVTSASFQQDLAWEISLLEDAAPVDEYVARIIDYVPGKLVLDLELPCCRALIPRATFYCVPQFDVGVEVVFLGDTLEVLQDLGRL